MLVTQCKYIPSKFSNANVEKEERLILCSNFMPLNKAYLRICETNLSYSGKKRQKRGEDGNEETKTTTPNRFILNTLGLFLFCNEKSLFSTANQHHNKYHFLITIFLDYYVPLVRISVCMSNMCMLFVSFG